eukprot:TRINITY_DN14_c0_g1_i1.p1 TRINITY_DN14_c0_g1~~TRINITY_DN14_c0_g1_i1.p1  ORF type:complete len:680 (+),score=80.48 TRINITY_DN14_c0_g1_i1:3279-5318(+)
MISQTEKSFDGVRKLVNADLDSMEKTVRAMRRSRRHIKAKQVMHLQREELDFEDLMSSSEDPLGDSFQNRTNNNDSALENDAKESEEECNFPRLALGGVPILENGEPLGATHSQEWISEYGGTSSQDSPEFIEYAHNHEAYKNAKDTVERNVLPFSYIRTWKNNTKQFMLQLITEQWYGSNEERTKKKQERREKKLAEKKQLKENSDKRTERHFIDSKGPTPRQDTSLMEPEEDKKEVANLADQLLNITDPKLEEPLPPLESCRPTVANNKEVLHDITLEEMNTSRLGPTLNITLDSIHTSDRKMCNDPEEIKENMQNAINVIDFNGSGKETMQNPDLSIIDNEELVAENDEEIIASDEIPLNPKKIINQNLEIIQENNSEFSNSNSLISGRGRKGNEPAVLKNCAALFTAREREDEIVKTYRRKVKSSRGNYEQREIIDELQENQEPLVQEEEENIKQDTMLEKSKEALETPLLQKKADPGNISTINITKSIPNMTRGSQLGSGSTNYTTLQARQAPRNSLPRTKLDPFATRLSQISWGPQGDTDNLILPTTGVLFGSLPLGDNTKETMCHSFMTKPTFAELGNGRQTPGASSSIIIKKLADDSMEGPLKISKKSIIPVKKLGKKAKLNISVQNDQKPAICLKRVRIKKLQIYTMLFNAFDCSYQHVCSLPTTIPMAQ